MECTVKVRICVDSTVKKYSLDGLLLNSKIADVKSQITKQCGIEADKIVVLHAGVKLSDDKTLDKIPGLAEGASLIVLPKPKRDFFEASQPSKDEIDTVLSSFYVATSDRVHRDILTNILDNPKTLTDLISFVPGFKHDNVAQALLKDHYLLRVCFSPQNIQKTVEAHPCLIEALQIIMSKLHEEATRLAIPENPIQAAAAAAAAGRGLRFGGRMFDPLAPDEEEAEGSDAEEPPAPAPAGPGLGAMGGGITAQQVAAAFAALGPGGPAFAALGPAGPTPRAPAPPQQRRPAVPAPAQGQHRAPPQGVGMTAGRAPQGVGITAGLLQQAMQQALVGAQQAQMQQLRDMGFTNDEENRRALAATNGNVEAALEWIINERERIDLD